MLYLMLHIQSSRSVCRSSSPGWVPGSVRAVMARGIVDVRPTVISMTTPQVMPKPLSVGMLMPPLLDDIVVDLPRFPWPAAVRVVCACLLDTCSTAKDRARNCALFGATHSYTCAWTYPSTTADQDCVWHGTCQVHEATARQQLETVRSTCTKGQHTYTGAIYRLLHMTLNAEHCSAMLKLLCAKRKQCNVRTCSHGL